MAYKLPVDKIVGSQNRRSGAEVHIRRRVVVRVIQPEDVVVGKILVEDWVGERP